MSSEPGTAAAASSIDGRPVRMPTCVADMCNWSWISGMTGGTDRMVSRRALPASQSSSSALSTRARENVRSAPVAAGMVEDTLLEPGQS